MSREQLQDEKLSVQKALLQFESTFGRPVSINAEFLHATAAAAVAHLSCRNSVCPSIYPFITGWISQKRCKSSPSAAWKTLVSGTVKLFHKFESGLPEGGC